MFGLMVLIENLSTIAWTTNTRVITAAYTNTSLVLGSLYVAQVKLIAGVLALVLTFIFWAFLRFTLIGRAIRAMGQNCDAALSVGINVRQLSAVMFGLGIAAAPAPPA